MRGTVILIFIFVVCSISLESEENQRYWIFFTDKNGVREPIDTVERIFYENEPVPERYAEAIYSITDSITIRSRWLNAVSVPATAQHLENIQALPFVKSTQPVARMARPQPVPDTHDDGVLQDELYPLDNYYGQSARQIQMHGIDVLHDTGITGSGVVIGFLDTGYRWNQHVALMDASVIAERDFVAEHYSTDVLPGSHYSHGTLVFSVVAGFDPGTFIGVAHDAEFLLGATEDIRSETPIEEDFWIAAVEWMEEMDVDIVSTSLGYSTFDPPYRSYSPNEMDGETAVTTIVADRAFERGILVVASAGNSGNSDWRIITSPADGKHVIATGALDSFGNLAGFSSRGPSADGRIKPDISAMGVSVAGAQMGESGYRFASGTSLSAPIVSGTAGLLLSARPDLTARELRQSLLMSAQREGNPDNEIGYGILDAPAALAYPVKRILPGGSTAIEVFLTGKDGLVEGTVSLHLRKMGDTEFIIHPFPLAEPSSRATSGLYRYGLSDAYQGQTIRFVITAKDSAGNLIRYPRDVSHEYFLSPVLDIITITERIIPDIFVLHQNFPNPFNDRTVIRFELPEDDHVAVKVYDLLGRHVASLTDAFFLAGVHEVTWQPIVYASGLYFYTIRYGTRLETGKMIYLR